MSSVCLCAVLLSYFIFFLFTFLFPLLSVFCLFSARATLVLSLWLGCCATSLLRELSDERTGVRLSESRVECACVAVIAAAAHSRWWALWTNIDIRVRVVVCAWSLRLRCARSVERRERIIIMRLVESETLCKGRSAAERRK